MTNAHAVAEALRILWPSGIQRNRVLAFITDVTPYMRTCARGLSVSYPKML